MAKKLKKFLILFDNTNLLYFPGQFITGRVLVELDEETPVLGLYFHIIGEGVVRLHSRLRDNYQDKENYIDFRMKLLGEGSARGERSAISGHEGSTRTLVLQSGLHSFPFKLGLPLGLPSTFLGKHGWVQYYCKTALREPSGLVHKNQQVFIVMSPIDLNLEPVVLTQPFHAEAEETIGVPCVSAGPLTCRVRLDRGGYVPGENIVINATIVNMSGATIRKSKAVLTETIHYTAKGKLLHSETRQLAQVEKIHQSRSSSVRSDQWDNELLYIPPLPPTNLRGCHLISIQYAVYFMITTKGVERPMKLQLPVMLATYPIRNSDGTLQRKHFGAHYPETLPVFRPWLEGAKFKK